MRFNVYNQAFRVQSFKVMCNTAALVSITYLLNNRNFHLELCRVRIVAMVITNYSSQCKFSHLVSQSVLSS